MHKHYLRAPLEVRALEEDGTFEGYGSVFGVVDAYNERVMPGAFNASIAEKGAEGVALLWQHRSDTVIGVYTEMREDERGLYVKGKLALSTEKGREAHELMKMGWKAGLSIGFVPLESEKAEDGVREVREVDLWEVSVVTFPANQASMVEAVRSKIEAGEVPTKRELEQLLTRDAGMTAQAAKALLSRGYDAMTDTRDADGEAIEALAALRKTLRG